MLPKYRSELAFERARKRVLPRLNLVSELSRRDRERLRSNVHCLDAESVGEEYQGSGKVCQKERCASNVNLQTSKQTLVSTTHNRSSN